MRVRVFATSLMAVFLATIPARADEEGENEAMGIAQRYGMDGLESLSGLAFTFNMTSGTTTISRQWTWDRAADRVTLKTREGRKDLILTYRPSDLSADDVALNTKVDRWFVNDRYWLLFPYHVAHDRGVDLTFDANEPLPIPPGNADRLTIAYADNVGYTPGDIYEIFYRDDRIIRQMIFRKGGSPEPSLIATWDDHARAGPLLVSLRHRTADGAREIWFSGVQVRRAGSAGWTAAAPAKPR